MTPRTLALLATFSALLSGCMQGAAPGPDAEEPHGYEVPLAPRGPEVPTCATLSIDAPGVHPSGEPLEIRLTLRNCGNATITLEPRACADPPRGFAIDIYPEGDAAGYTLTAQGARRAPLPCEPSNETALDLAPGGTITLARTWDARLPRDCAPGATCPTDPATGNHTLLALAPYGSKLAQAQAQVTLLPRAAAVPEPTNPPDR